ncbi:MAG TPA: Ig-like domain-containing protein, partial [Candidatus Limnocylindria bacterium]|nr:Ig-like domain-containing protein [Candidatus Limnocylindria bacterium]
MHSIRNVRAACRAPFESLGHLLSAHRAVARVSITAIALALVFVVSQQGVSRAGPEPVVGVPRSILPANIGVGVATDAFVTIPFDRPVDRASVEAGLSVIPDAAVSYRWSADNRSVRVAPRRHWMTDERYLLLLSSAVRFQDGASAGNARRLSFTTETAPTVSDFRLQYVPQDPARLQAVHGDGLAEYAPRANGVVAGTIETRLRAAAPRTVTKDTAAEVSAHTAVSIDFTAPMDAGDVAEHFAINPHVPGDLSWRGRTLVFTPSQPLDPGARYAISVAGVHDVTGNPLGGDSSFSFTTITAGQPIKVSPKTHATNVTSGEVKVWFSQPMATDRTARVFSLTDLTSKKKIAGKISWNEAKTQLSFKSTKALAKGHSFRITLAKGAVDGDGNEVTLTSTFKTKAAPAPARTTSSRSGPPPAPPGPASSLTGYALNQVNAARSSYGFGSLGLNSAVSAVANAHAWDMLR